MNAAGSGAVESAVLRAFIGNDDYADVEKLAGILYSLKARGVIGEEGHAVIMAAIADEMIVQAVIVAEFGKALSFGDTPAPEDPT